MILDELITILGFDIKDQEKLAKYKHAVGAAVSELKTMATVGTAALGAVLTGITAVNNETSKLANLAQTVGLSYDMVNGLGGAIKAIGLDYEHVIDLAEEMHNKVGESKSIYDEWVNGGKKDGKELKLVGGMEDAFKGLDFSIVDKKFKDLNLEEKFKAFSSMDADKQFKLVLDTASTMKDTQEAVSMVDILMGGEANKILGYLRSQSTTLSKLLKKRAELNMLDEEGVAGAKAYAKQVADTSSLFGSIGKQLSGLAGAYLAPILEKMNNWFRVNKAIVKIKLKEYVESFFFALKKVWSILGDVGTVINRLAVALGGWEVVLPVLATIIAYFNPFKAIVMGVILAIDDLMTGFRGGKSVVGDFVNYFKANFPLLSDIIEAIGNVFQSVFGLFKAIYDRTVAVVFALFQGEGNNAVNLLTAMGIVFKNVFNALSSAISFLASIIKGDFEGMKENGLAFVENLTKAFSGLVDFFTNGAKIFRNAWGVTIDWIMSKIKWVTDQIALVTDSVSNFGDDIADSVSSSIAGAWDGAVNFFGGDSKKEAVSPKEQLKHFSEKIVNNNNTKEIISKVKESAKFYPAINKMPSYSPANTNGAVNNAKIEHKHNNSYNINVTGVKGNATVIAETIKGHIVNTKSIEKANINKTLPIHRAT